MAKKSNNPYYASADVGRPVEALKKIMGLSGNADSNYLTNLGKVSRLEGTEMDNREKAAVWSAMNAMKEGMSPEEWFQTTLAPRGKGLNRAQTITAQLEQPYRVDFQKQRARGEGSKADEAGSSAGVEALMLDLAEQIKSHGMRPDIADYDTRNPNEMRPYGDAIAGATANFEDLVRKLGAIKGGSSRGQHKTAEHAELELASDLGVDKSVMNYNDTRALAAKNVGEARVQEIEQRTAKTLSDMEIAKDIGHENVNKIRQGVLNLVNESDWKQKNLKQRNLLIQEYIKSEGQRLKKLTAQAGQEELELEELPTTLAALRETLKQKKRKASELAEQAKLDTLARPELLKLQQEIAELEKGIKGQTKGKVEAQKDRAINLADMSELELKALPDEILKKAQELGVRIRKGEQQIELAKARTDDVNMARNVKILQKANMNNKNALQQLLSPHIQDHAKAKAMNEAEKLANQIKLKMIPKPEAKKPPEDITIDPDSEIFSPSTWLNKIKGIPAQEYSDISASMFKHKDKIKSGKLNPAIKNSILTDMMSSLRVDAKKAQQIYDHIVSTF